MSPIEEYPPGSGFPGALGRTVEESSCGYDFGAPAAEGYTPPFPFNGTIHSVTFDLSGELIADDDAQLARMMAQQ